MANPLDWSLLSGVFPVVLTVLGAGALTYLASRRKRRWYTRTVPVAALAGVAVALLVWWLVDDVWHPFAGPFPVTVLTWTGVTTAALGLTLARLRSARWRGRVAAALALVVIVLMALNQINVFFGYFPNLRDTLGLPFANQVSASRILGGSAADPPASPGRALVATWKPPHDMPKAGEVVEVNIPGTVSKFQARSAWLYLPPAYLTARRPLLPVLMMIGGQPGTSRDWLDGNNLSLVMDEFASTHHGLAPVVVMPDALGSFWANPLCINSQLGQSDTYLTVDVPDWVRSHLRVDEDTSTWAVGGGSFGGTCAWQLAVFHPQLFPTFLDFSGVYEQLRGTLQQTIDAAFNGNARKFAEVNPAQVLVHHTRPNTWATIGSGSTDSYYLNEVKETAALCQRAGMHVRFVTAPGGHAGPVFQQLLAGSMEWLARRDGIVAR